MKLTKTLQNTIDALLELEQAAVKARVLMDGNDLATWKKVLALETKIRQIRETALEAAE
jgi:hypothetical protein